MSDDLDERLSSVREVLARTPDALHVPFGLDFLPYDGERHLADWDDHAHKAAAGETFEDAVLYVHLPFCARVCSYCLLSSTATPGKSRTEAYLRALQLQIDRVEPVVRAMRFSTLHLGGGTPTLLSEREFDTLLGSLARFRRTDRFQIGIEAHPATTTAAKVEVLRAHDVDRVSFGVETMTREVLEHVNRGDQTSARVTSAVELVRNAGLSVNLDLLAGLPGETEDSFDDSIRQALALEPDSMSVNRFLAENSSLGREGNAPDARQTEETDRMLMRADAIVRTIRPPRWPERALDAPGYGTQYVWDRGEKAREYFQQDMIGPISTLALGHGALGHVHGRHFATAAGDFSDYVTSLEQGRMPSMLAAEISPRFELAFHLADRATRGDLSLRDLSRTFHADARRIFGPELSFLLERELLVQTGERIRKKSDRTFQVTHLLAFLLFSSSELRTMRDSIAKDARKSLTLRQYDAIEAELPPSLFWCRIAIRASISARQGL